MSIHLGITGHQRLNTPSDWDWVDTQLRDFLKSRSPAVGVTSLAAGADQAFARVIVEFAGSLHVVVPFQGYERAFADASSLDSYKSLLELAEEVEVLQRDSRSDEECYLEAGKRVARLSQVLLAVWDGQPARGLGGTGDMVAFAISRGTPIYQINPVAKATSWISRGRDSQGSKSAL